MTTEQYTRAIEISERIKELEQVKRAISSTINHRLTYEYKEHGEFEAQAHPSWELKPIEKILDRHDKMIREEIDQEIDALTKEIETL